MTSDWRKRISVDPTVCHGKPCIRGTRTFMTTTTSRPSSLWSRASFNCWLRSNSPARSGSLNLIAFESGEARNRERQWLERWRGACGSLASSLRGHPQSSVGRFA